MSTLFFGFNIDFYNVNSFTCNFLLLIDKSVFAGVFCAFSNILVEIFTQNTQRHPLFCINRGNRNPDFVKKEKESVLFLFSSLPLLHMTSHATLQPSELTTTVCTQPCLCRQGIRQNLLKLTILVGLIGQLAYDLMDALTFSCKFPTIKDKRLKKGGQHCAG